MPIDIAYHCPLIREILGEYQLVCLYAFCEWHPRKRDQNDRFLMSIRDDDLPQECFQKQPVSFLPQKYVVAIGKFRYSFRMIQGFQIGMGHLSESSIRQQPLFSLIAPHANVACWHQTAFSPCLPIAFPFGQEILVPTGIGELSGLFRIECLPKETTSRLRLDRVHEACLQLHCEGSLRLRDHFHPLLRQENRAWSRILPMNADYLHVHLLPISGDSSKASCPCCLRLPQNSVQNVLLWDPCQVWNNLP